MDLGLRASLVNFTLAALGGSTDDAFGLVAQIEADRGAPTDTDDLRRFMSAIEMAAVKIPIG